MYTGTEQPLYDAFGIPNMHLSYGVVEQTVSGVADTRYIMQAQLRHNSCSETVLYIGTLKTIYNK
jgi:hypothetical protein